MNIETAPRKSTSLTLLRIVWYVSKWTAVYGIIASIVLFPLLTLFFYFDTWLRDFWAFFYFWLGLVCYAGGAIAGGTIGFVSGVIHGVLTSFLYVIFPYSHKKFKLGIILANISLPTLYILAFVTHFALIEKSFGDFIDSIKEYIFFYLLLILASSRVIKRVLSYLQNITPT
ncbi:MAG: hypothetical protein H6671_12820 [Anaerolineaceae bacterium]|nr:hypothetical protein [Anaerolineaceae bacterium]